MIQLRQTMRRLRDSPAFTLTTVLTLAIGIGATTAIFSVINGILIKPLPYPESDRLIALVHQTLNNDRLAASPAIYFTYREHNETFESVALWWPSTGSITGSGDPEEVRTLRVTHEFLSTLRVAPALGRTFTQTDDLPGSAKTVILSHGYWQRRFGGAEDVLGEALIVDGEPRTVIGVLPQGFRFGEAPAEILTAMQPSPATSYFGPFGERGIARLKDGITLAQASADVARMVPAIMDTFPPPPGISREMLESVQFGPNLAFLKDDVVGDLDDVLWVLMGTIGMLLIIACANVANLQLVRIEVRGHELAIRRALGAGRGAIGRSLLWESTSLGLVGGAAGLMLAALGLPVLLAIAAAELPSVFEITIDPTVLVFTLAIALASGCIFGLISVAKFEGTGGVNVLRSAGRSHSPSRERHRVRNALVVGQVALALILLVASGLMIRTFVMMRDVEPGFTEPDRIQTARISIPQGAVSELDRVIRIQNQIQDRLSEIAGVESVAFTSSLPLSGDAISTGFYFEDIPLAPGAIGPQAQFRLTSPRFFETMGTPLVVGRDFVWRDSYAEGLGRVAVVSESLARRVWGTPMNALGKRLRASDALPWVEVVGVVDDVHHLGLDRPAPDTVYLALNDALAGFGAGRTVSFVVRSERVGTAGFLEDVQQAIWSVDRRLPLARAPTMDELYRQSMARTSLTLVLLAVTGAMALLLGLVGIYGVIGYMLTRRTREIGVRIALGARHAQVKRMLLSQVMALVAIGVALGLSGAAALTQLMESLLFGVTALDPATYVSGVAVLVATAALAGYLPARRVTRIAPITALREE